MSTPRLDERGVEAAADVIGPHLEHLQCGQCGGTGNDLRSNLDCTPCKATGYDVRSDEWRKAALHAVTTEALAAYFAALDREEAAERIAATLYGIQRFGDSYADNPDGWPKAALFFENEEPEARSSWLFKARAVLTALGFPTPDTEEQT